jgi:hypothetical protein
MFFGKVKEGVPEAEIDRLVTAWNAMPSKVDTLRSITAGRNACATDQRYTIALVADFDDWAGYKVYADHPAHEQIKHDISSKIIDADNKSTIQLEL